MSKELVEAIGLAIAEEMDRRRPDSPFHIRAPRAVLSAIEREGYMIVKRNDVVAEAWVSASPKRG